MIEVELKFALSISSFPALQEKLRTMKFTGCVQNTDVYYDTAGFDFIQQAVFVRIRNNHQLQFKIDASAELTHVQSMERTFPLIPEPRQAETMNALFARFLPAWQAASTVETAIHDNGLIELAYIKNSREEYVQGDITLSVDHVKGLGDFLEIETHREEDTDTSDALARLHTFVSDLDLQPVHVGYVELWLRIHNPQAYQLGKYHV